VRILPLTVLVFALTGCIAKTAVDVVTLPVKAASKTVDVLTTSQAEADQKRGRAIRRHEECLGREERRARKEKREPDYARCPEPKAR
jgi:predicted Holliday junction resolvase-like endonuclease